MRACELILVAEEDVALVGFLELSLREHADGCASSPVPYIEAWYVITEKRGQGIGRRLVATAESWARNRGFAEIASDTQFANRASQAAHAALGFAESGRFVAFRKSLSSN